MPREEAWVPGSSLHTLAASAVSPMPTNKLHQQANTADGFDVVDVANGAQLATAGHKAEESGTQVPAKDQPHGATNEPTSHVHRSTEAERGHSSWNAVAPNIYIHDDDATANANYNAAAMTDAGVIDGNNAGSKGDGNASTLLSGAQTGTPVAGAAEASDLVESQDKAISRGTDSPSHRPAAGDGDIPTAQTTSPLSTSTLTKDVETSEADVSVSGDDAINSGSAYSDDADRTSATVLEGDRQKTTTQQESATSADDKAEKNLDISQPSDGGAESINDSPTMMTETDDKLNILGSNSLHARSNVDSATVTYDKEANQNSGLPSSPSAPGSKHVESDVDHSESDGMISMKSEGMERSQGDNQESTFVKSSSMSQSRSGGVTDDSSDETGDHHRHHDVHRNGMDGMKGMLDSGDLQGHTLSHTHTGSSPHSLTDSPDTNDRGDVISDNAGRQATSSVSDDLPKTTDSDSSNVSRASAAVNSDFSGSSSPGSVNASHSLPRNVSLTGSVVNASLSTQQSLTDTQPQDNGSLTNQNARLGAEETLVGHLSQTQHHNDLEASGNSIGVQSRNNSSNNGANSQSMQNMHGQGQQGGTVNQAQNSSSIPPLSGGNGNGGGVGVGGHSGSGVGGAGGQVTSSGRDREKSVFLRLSNQIQELEMNMSLFSSYLDQISTRLVD